MRKLRKFISMLLTMALILTMSTAVFAADNPAVEKGESSILVTNLRHGGDSVGGQTVKIYLVYSFDETDNAWVLADQFTSSDLPAKVTTEEEKALEEKIAALAKKVKAEPGSFKEDASDTVKTGQAQFTGLKKGLYIVLAEDGTTTGAVTYNPMIAQTYMYHEDTHLIDSAKATLVAKYSELTIDKKDDDDDKAVHIGQVLTYTINGTIRPEAEYFTITDTLTGADYDFETLKVKVGNQVLNANQYTLTKGADDRKGSFELTIPITDRTFDGAEVEVTYKAVVNGDALNGVTNTVTDMNETKSKTVKDFTAKILVEKTDTAGNPLVGASFRLHKGDKIALLTKKADGVYEVAGWVEAGAEELSVIAGVDQNGCIMKLDKTAAAEVLGVDIGVYTFEETAAPFGYSINANGGMASVKMEDKDQDGFVSSQEELVVTSATGENAVKDTRLSGLPATGGRGTILFTVVGCAVMITMAGLYFASKKRSAQ